MIEEKAVHKNKTLWIQMHQGELEKDYSVKLHPFQVPNAEGPDDMITLHFTNK